MSALWLVLLPVQELRDAQLISAYLIFIASYTVFAFGKFPGMKIDRAGMAVIGAAMMVAVGALPPSQALVAALGAALMLTTRTVEPREVYKGIDWGLLVFFTGLFLIVGGAQEAGIVDALLALLQHFNLQNTVAFSIAVALLSNVVSNVPAVMLLKSLVPGLTNPHLGWLALAMASTLAGNLTITGSVANLIVAESAREVAPIRFREYFRAGLPITILTMAIGVGWLKLVG